MGRDKFDESKNKKNWKKLKYIYKEIIIILIVIIIKILN